MCGAGFKLWILLCVMCTAVVDSYDILVFMNVPSQSHHKWMMVYVEALAKRGHSVTYVAINELKNPPANVHPHFIEDGYGFYQDMNFTEISQAGPYSSFTDLLHYYEVTTRAQQASKGLQSFMELIKKKKFDGVVYDLAGCPFILGAVDVLGRPPLLGITAFGAPSWVMDISATPYPIANSAHFLYPLGKQLSFLNRLENAVFYLFARISHELKFMPLQEEIARQSFGPDVRSISEILGDINVNMVNLNWASDNTFPLPPSLIPIGGLHIKQPKPLPKDLQEFLDSATSGAIYFSLGSNIQSSGLDSNFVEELIKAFERIAPIKVLWKWESDYLPGKPENVKIGKWLPQNDILAHPNIRMFITHGGMLSSQEAVYHGVPIIGIPFFADQSTNVKRAESSGYGLALQFLDLNAESLVSRIREIISNPGYKNAATRLSKIFRDDLNPPLERAMFWTEYAIRHNGAAHLKPYSYQLTWFQSGLYDIIIVFLSVAGLSLYVLCKLLGGLQRGSAPQGKKCAACVKVKKS